MLLPYRGSSGTDMALSLKRKLTVLSDQKLLVLIWESKSLCKYCDNAEGKLSFLPYLLFTKYLKPIRTFIPITTGHELFTFISRKRRFPLNFTGKGKRRVSKVKWFPKSEVELVLGTVAYPHNHLSTDTLITHCTQEILKITTISRVVET